MLLAKPPYYTYSFGSLGKTLDSARQREFFQWFHLEETERRAEPPGEAVRFRPSGAKFRELCYLDALTTEDGRLARLELVAARSFLDGLDGREAPFAQDLVKSFLFAALPDACRYLLADFLAEMNALGGEGKTPGYLVFRGRQAQWKAQTGWSRLELANLALSGGEALVVEIGPNPSAPNAKPVEAAADGGASSQGPSTTQPN